MNSRQTHIIKSCRWQTHFDSKSQAVSLQNQLSWWSQHQMNRDVDSFFNGLCDENKLLTIKTLELNLGVLPYENFQQELSKRFMAVLKEVLQIAMDSRTQSNNVELLDIQQSYLEIVSDFLHAGIQHRSTNQQETLEDIISTLFLEYETEFMHLIRSLARYETVRKRIAWQFKEKNIKEIIKRVEPSHHQEIFDFSEHLWALQKQENIVQSTTSDFKKNIWYWILNHLFTERGSLFNKMQFVESMLMQMAHHFNLKHAELFDLIEDALNKTPSRRKERVELLEILKVLFKKRAFSKYDAKSTRKQNEEYWKTLEQMVQGTSETSAMDQQQFYNELVFHLSNQDKGRFVSLFTNHKDSLAHWTQVTKALNHRSFTSLLKSLESDKEELLHESFQQMASQKILKILGISIAELKGLTLMFSTKNKSKIITSDSYVRFIIHEVSKLTKRTEETLLLTMISAASPGKSSEYIGVSNHALWYSLYKEKVLQTNQSKVTIETVGQLLEHSTTEKSVLILHDWISNQPSTLADVLTRSQEFLPVFMDTVATSKLVDFFALIRPELSKILQRMFSFVDAENDMISQQLRHAFKESMIKIAIRVSLARKQIRATEFVDILLRATLYKSQLWTYQNVAVLQNSVWNLMQTQNKSLAGRVLFTKQLRTLKEVLQWIPSKVLRKEEVAKDLLARLHAHKISVKELEAHKKVLLKYFAKTDFSLDQIVQQFSAIISATSEAASPEIETQLRALYWKVLLQYQTHKGDVRTLQKMYKIAVQGLFTESFKHKKGKSQQEVGGNPDVKILQRSLPKEVFGFQELFLGMIPNTYQKRDIVKVLSKQFESQKLTLAKLASKEQELIAFLLGDGFSKKTFLSAYADQKYHGYSKKKLALILDKLFWKTVFEYDVYQGNTQKF